MPKKQHLYILKLCNDKYYVGITSSLKSRIKNHFGPMGTSWTKKHRPIEVVETITPADKELEKQKTIEYMIKYGFQNVRGAGWTQSSEIPMPHCLREKMA